MSTQTEIDDAAALAAGNEIEQNADEAAAEAEAALAAGFDQVSGREPASDDFDNTTTNRNDDGTDGRYVPGTDGAATDDDATASASDGTATITEARAREMFQQALDEERSRFDEKVRRLEGRYGNLNGRIEELSKRKALTKEDLAALKDEYEDIADLLGTNLPDSHEPLTPLVEDDEPAPTGATSETGTGATDDGEAIPTAQQDRILDRLSPGWAPKLQSEQFAQWLASLPANERDDIASSEDPLRIADEIARFDTWDKAAKQRASTDRGKSARLAGAETPTRGKAPGGPDITSAEDDLEAGYRRVKGGRR